MKRHGGLAVLLVEDDPAQLSEYSALLRGLGYEVRGANSAESALELVEQKSFDVIITDNVLPGINGLRSIQEFAKRTPAPVLLMTSNYCADVVDDARLLGARVCLKTPLDPAELDWEIQKAISSDNL